MYYLCCRPMLLKFQGKQENERNKIDEASEKGSSIMTISIMTFSITTISIKGLFVTLGIKHYVIMLSVAKLCSTFYLYLCWWAICTKWSYAECPYIECCGAPKLLWVCLPEKEIKNYGLKPVFVRLNTLYKDVKFYKWF